MIHIKSFLIYISKEFYSIYCFTLFIGGILFINGCDIFGKS